MTKEIEKFRLKLRNTATLKRSNLSFNIEEARALDKEIKSLEEQIERLEFEALQSKTLTVDIVGREF